MSELVRVNEHLALNRAFGTKELSDLLEKAMEREPAFRTKKSFAPSGLGYSGSCPRYWYYAFNGANFVYTSDAAAVANMDAGTAAGQRLANLLDKAGLLVDAEVKVEHDDPPIFGYIDAIVNWKGEEVLVEIKTTRSNVWNSRVMNNNVPGYQLAQLLVYMHVTNHEKGFFLTENKDTHELFVLPIKMNDEYRKLVEDILDWMRTVKNNADSGELPTRPFNRSSMQCKGCPVRDTCWEGYVRGSVNGSDPAPGTITLPVLELPK